MVSTGSHPHAGPREEEDSLAKVGSFPPYRFSPQAPQAARCARQTHVDSVSTGALGG